MGQECKVCMTFLHWTNTLAELIENLLQTWEMREDGHVVTCVRNWSIFIDQRLNFEIFNVSNESDVDLLVPIKLL
jgi:hypothetical protein